MKFYEISHNGHIHTDFEISCTCLRQNFIFQFHGDEISCLWRCHMEFYEISRKGRIYTAFEISCTCLRQNFIFQNFIFQFHGDEIWGKLELSPSSWCHGARRWPFRCKGVLSKYSSYVTFLHIRISGMAQNVYNVMSFCQIFQRYC